MIDAPLRIRVPANSPLVPALEAMEGKTLTLEEFAKRIDDRVRSDAVSRMLMEQNAFMDGFDRNWPGIYIKRSFVSGARSRLHNAWLALKGHDISSDDY